METPETPFTGYDAPFSDAGKEAMITEFEDAIEAGETGLLTAKTKEAICNDWKEVIENTLERKPVTLHIRKRDIQHLEVQAEEAGMPCQTYIATPLHHVANGDKVV